jgi:1-acyl-sn-glycerol-3-phosphate acyltransferase
MSRFMIRALGAHVKYRKNFTQKPEGPVLYIANHTTYIDVPVLSSVIPAAFVTSIDMGDNAAEGLLTRLGGCLFVERRNHSQLLGDIRGIMDMLGEGFDVVVFPEGTTFNGSKLLKFKSSLVEAAVQAQIPVVPVTICYRAIDGKPISAANRDKIFYYGEMEFVKHFKAILGLRRVDVDVVVHPTIEPGWDRKALTQRAREAVASAYVPVSDEISVTAAVKPTAFPEWDVGAEPTEYFS